MAYIDNADIILRVTNATAVQLTTDTGTVVDSDVLDEVRQSAEGEVNGKIATRLGAPVDLTAYPELAAMLKSLTLDIAAFLLHSRRPPVREDIRTVRDDAVKRLDRIAEGKEVLPALTTPPSTTANGPTSTWGGSDAVASRGNIGT